MLKKYQNTGCKLVVIKFRLEIKIILIFRYVKVWGTKQRGKKSESF